MIRDSMGACICNNQQGRIVELGYCKELNPKNHEYCEKEYNARNK